MTTFFPLRWTLVLLLLVGVSGCSLFPRKPPTPDFMVTWSQTLESMGLVAVLPLSEDVRVGDIFVHPEDPTSSPKIVGVPRWASLPLLEALRDEYSSRRPWPSTPLIENGGSSPEATDDGFLFTPAEGTSRLRSVALAPSVSFRFRGDDLPLPTDVIAASVGRQWDEEVDLVIKIGAAGAYGLSASELLPRLIEPSEDGEDGDEGEDEDKVSE